jgi:hypothetical protein
VNVGTARFANLLLQVTRVPRKNAPPGAIGRDLTGGEQLPKNGEGAADRTTGTTSALGSMNSLILPVAVPAHGPRNFAIFSS